MALVKVARHNSTVWQTANIGVQKMRKICSTFTKIKTIVARQW